MKSIRSNYFQAESKHLLYIYAANEIYIEELIFVQMIFNVEIVKINEIKVNETFPSEYKNFPRRTGVSQAKNRETAAGRSETYVNPPRRNIFL